MHLIEIRQDLQDTSVKTSIYENSKIIRQLETLVEITNDLSSVDCEYIAILLFKSKTLLNKAYTIFKINKETKRRKYAYINGKYP